MSRKFFAGITPSRQAPVDLDTGVPHPARVYDYILGGKDNFAADQAAARTAMAANPHVATAMRENRAVMRRMAAFLAGPAGMRQFLDIGTGLLTGLDLVPPGIVPMAEWRADDEPQPRPSPLEAGGYAAVARKD
jgi:hypothetical protein